MTAYSYAECLTNSYQVNWRIADVVGGRAFDLSRPWLPSRLSAAGAISCLDDDEKRKLTHVEMAAYAHLFGYVEAFIAPKMTGLAQKYELDDRDAFDALTNFAAEEIKHMNLFRAVGDLVRDALGFPLQLLDDPEDVARFVLGKHTGAVLLLTACIEWFTQLHYTAGFRDDDTLDPLTKRIFKCHWQEEAQHAKVDHLETLAAFGDISDADRDRAVDHLIELVGAVDGLLQKQAGLDVENLERYAARVFTEEEKRAVEEQVLRAKRYTFLESGVTHPNFQQLFGEVTTATQQERVQKALAGIL